MHHAEPEKIKLALGALREKKITQTTNQLIIVSSLDEYKVPFAHSYVASLEV